MTKTNLPTYLSDVIAGDQKRTPARPSIKIRPNQALFQDSMRRAGALLNSEYESLHVNVKLLKMRKLFKQ